MEQKWFQGSPCFQLQAKATIFLMQACTHNARLLCGVASLHSMHKFNERPVRNARRATLKDASVRNATRATVSYHQRFFWRATSRCWGPRFSSRDPCPHAGVVSTRCSENCALISRHAVDIGVVSNPSLASVSLPWLQPRAGSIHRLPLHHCCLDASLFHSRSTQSHSLLWASGNEIEKHLSLEANKNNELEAKKNVKHLKQL